MPVLKKLSSILFIDDDINTNFLNEKLIKRLGIGVFVKSFVSAKEALDFLGDGSAANECYPRPGILFLDLNMPYMNGWEFMKQYGRLPAEIRSEIRVIMLSSSIDTEDKVQAKKDNNISRFMSKPLLKEPLMNVINAYFETWQHI